MIPNIKYFLSRALFAVLLCLASVVAVAQKNADKLFLQGQQLQKTLTVSSQEKAIKKFAAAKVIYTSAEKKAMCDNQISNCRSNISNLKRRSRPQPKKKVASNEEANKDVQDTLSLAQEDVFFSANTSDSASIMVNAPSKDWTFDVLEGVSGEDDFLQAHRNTDTTAIVVVASENPLTLARRQSVKVICGNESKTLVVRQRGKEVTLQGSESLLSFKAKGGVKSMQLFTNSDSIVANNNSMAWYIASKPDWIIVQEGVIKGGLLGKAMAAVGKPITESGYNSSTTATSTRGIKTYNIIINASPLVKHTPEYTTGRTGEIEFASQDKRYKVTVRQQK